MTPYVHNSDKYAHIPHLNTHTQRHKFRRTSVPVRLASQITQVCRSFSMAIFDGDGTHTHTLTHTGAEVAFLLLQLPQLPVLGTAVCGVVIAGATWAAQRAAMMKARLEQHRVRCKFEETIVACMKYAFVGTRCVWW